VLFSGKWWFGASYNNAEIAVIMERCGVFQEYTTVKISYRLLT